MVRPLLFLFVVAVIGAATPAAAGILQTAQYHGSTYHLLDTDGTKWWTDAQVEAQQLGGNLVTINSDAENQFIFNTFSATAIAYANANSLPDRNNISFWIGLSDHVVEGQYQWVSGETSSYSNWANGQPQNGVSNEDFGGMFVNFGPPGQWHDLIGTTAAADLPFGIVEIVVPEPSAILLFIAAASAVWRRGA